MAKKISRRDFLKFHAQSGLFLAGSATGIFIPRLSFASTIPDIGVAKGKTVEATKAAVNLIGGIESVVKNGDRVLIKPNMSFARSPEAASNTHPDVVKTVAAMCKEAGASKVIILDHTLAPGKRCLQISGIGPACRAIDKNMVHAINNSSFYKQVNISGARSLAQTDVAKEFLKADVLIAVPVAKSHSATGVSLSMKGMMGLIYNRRIMHRMDLHETIVDLASILKADLTIIDGTRVLSTGGPGGPGRVLKKDTIIASKDMVAADAFAVAAFEWYGKKFKPTQVKHIRLAHERGLGRADIENLSVKTISI
ncbi:MAG: DUF362 domain-containing protein [Deltaproteobacteria bacterium]|jgi:uncharacterized protein (DUF362 family)|nr:DUF362 domain-containing protein [Deltaproteobacteria bacterium]